MTSVITDTPLSRPHGAEGDFEEVVYLGVPLARLDTAGAAAAIAARPPGPQFTLCVPSV